MSCRSDHTSSVRRELNTMIGVACYFIRQVRHHVLTLLLKECEVRNIKYNVDFLVSGSVV